MVTALRFFNRYSGRTTARQIGAFARFSQRNNLVGSQKLIWNQKILFFLFFHILCFVQGIFIHKTLGQSVVVKIVDLVLHKSGNFVFFLLHLHLEIQYLRLSVEQARSLKLNLCLDAMPSHTIIHQVYIFIVRILVWPSAAEWHLMKTWVHYLEHSLTVWFFILRQKWHSRHYWNWCLMW